MSNDDNTPFRLVAPRKWALAAATGLVAMQPVSILPFAAAPAQAATQGSEAGESGETGTTSSSAEAGESGESGESGVTRAEGPAHYLTELGLFEATHRIVAALYAAGEVTEAQEHLEGSHHADYEDIEHDLEAHGATDFEDEAEAFADAVMEGAAPDVVAARAADVLAAIDAARNAAEVSARNRLMSIRDLMMIAAADFEAGVEDGKVSEPHEYRDAWGFAAVARARATALAASAEADLAKAGHDVLEQLDKTTALLPGALAEAVDGDASILHGAAGWIEIIALRLKQ